MSFLRTFTPWRPEEPPGRQSVPEFIQAAGWTREQFAAARALGFPEPLEVVEQRHGVMVAIGYVAPEAAAEWRRDFDRLIAGLTSVTFSRPGVSNQIALAEVLDGLGWTPEQHATAVQWFAFPRAHDAEVRDASGARMVAVLRRHEVDRWLGHVRQLAPAI